MLYYGPMPTKKTSPSTNPTSTKKMEKTAKKQASTAEKKTSTGPSLLSENIKFTITIPAEQTKAAYQKAVHHMGQHLTLAGFRKGKAPAKLVEEKIGSQALIEHALDYVLSHAYVDAIQEKNLKPITDPRVNPVSLEKDQPWTFEVEVAEQPEIDLKNLDALLQKAKIEPVVKEGKKDKESKDSKKNKDKTEAMPTDDAVLHAALVAIINREDQQPLQIPSLLAERESNRTLAKLVEQLDRMKVSLEDYLKSTGKTVEQVRQEHLMHAITGYQVEFTLAAIAREQNITAHEDEVSAMIAAIPDENVRKSYETEDAKVHLSASIIKQKVVKYLVEETKKALKLA